MNGNSDRLAHRIKARRRELGLTQDQLRNLGGPSPDTVVKFERGSIAESPQDRTLEGFDRALSWKVGSARAILDGQEPAPTFTENDRTVAISLRPVPDPPHHQHQSGQADTEDWAPIPRAAIQDIVLDAHKLLTAARMGDNMSADDIIELASRIHASAAGMLALAIAAERDDTELYRLIDQLDHGNREGEHNAQQQD